MGMLAVHLQRSVLQGNLTEQIDIHEGNQLGRPLINLLLLLRSDDILAPEEIHPETCEASGISLQ